MCNLCTSRLGFLITCLAALRNRCLLVLPPSGEQRRPHGRARGRAARGPSSSATPRPGPSRVRRAHRASGSYLSCRPEWQTAAADASALAWQPAWDEVAVRLYTSGSTGTPQPQPKTLRHLVRGRADPRERLEKEVEGGLAALERIVCSVPPQHMFGLECSVMLPLARGIPVLDRRPLLPADVRAAFAGGRPGAWIATPMHLRNLVESFESVPCVPRRHRLDDAALAGRSRGAAKTLVHAPVVEIYGSTETGALAMRRTARESGWRALDDVQLEPARGATLGPRLALRFPGDAARRARARSAAAASLCSAGRTT